MRLLALLISSTLKAYHRRSRGRGSRRAFTVTTLLLSKENLSSFFSAGLKKKKVSLTLSIISSRLKREWPIQRVKQPSLSVAE